MSVNYEAVKFINISIACNRNSTINKSTYNSQLQLSIHLICVSIMAR